MEISPFVTGVWLIWLLLVIGKVSIGLNPKNMKQVSKDTARAALVIVGAYVARVASSECSDDAQMAFAYASAVATVAVMADAICTASSGHIMRPGTAAILSASVIAVAEAVLRTPDECYNVAAPALIVPTLLGVALSSTRKHI